MPRESLKSKQHRAAEITQILKSTYPEATVTLDHTNPWELVVGTILAAQCTDKKVNTVTPTLFSKWPGPAEMAEADYEDVQDVVHPLGFFRQKARSLIEMSRDVVDKFGGQVPGTIEELTTLRGVGRKTANVVLAHCFTGGSVIVDTHCRRISQLLGLTTEDDPYKIEKDLQKIVVQEDWSIFGTLLVWHGREICIARRPQCERCPVLLLCPYGQSRLNAPKAR